MKPKQTFYSKSRFTNDKLIGFYSKVETKTSSTTWLIQKKSQLSCSLPKTKYSKIKPIPYSLLGTFRQNIPSIKQSDSYKKKKIPSKSDYFCNEQEFHNKQIQKNKSIPSSISTADSKYKSFFNEKESRNHNKSNNISVDKGKHSFSVIDNGISLDSFHYFPNQLIGNKTVNESSGYDILKEIGYSTGPEDMHVIFVGINQRKKQLYKQLNENLSVPDEELYYDYLDIE